MPPRSDDDEAMDDPHCSAFTVLMDREWEHGVTAAVAPLSRFYERFADSIRTLWPARRSQAATQSGLAVSHIPMLTLARRNRDYQTVLSVRSFHPWQIVGS